MSRKLVLCPKCPGVITGATCEMEIGTEICMPDPSTRQITMQPCGCKAKLNDPDYQKFSDTLIDFVHI